MPTGGCKRSEPVRFKVIKIGRKYVTLEHKVRDCVFSDDYLPRRGITKDAIRSKVNCPDTFEFFSTPQDIEDRKAQLALMGEASRRIYHLRYVEMTLGLAEDLLLVMNKHGVTND